MPTRKVSSKLSDDLRPEYDFSALKGAVRGKYYRRALRESNVVLLEPDVARAFPNDKAVNEALRALLNLANKRVHTRTPRSSRPA
jgi:hypothetical protein